MPNHEKRLLVAPESCKSGISVPSSSDAWHGLLIAGKIGILKSVKMRAASEEFS
jgi:hypothetical protein